MAGASMVSESMEQELAANNERMRFWQRCMLLLTMMCYLFYYTGRQTFGFTILGIEAELGIDKEAIGWISAALLWSYAIGQTINGNLADKFGGRRMMSVGAILSTMLNWVTSLGTSFVSLILPWGLNGYAQSMGWAPGSRVISNWWPSETRGKAYGFYGFGCWSFCGGVFSAARKLVGNCRLVFHGILCIWSSSCMASAVVALGIRR